MHWAQGYRGFAKVRTVTQRIHSARNGGPHPQ